MQGLVNFMTAIADSIAVALPALCYLMACFCFLFAGWTFRDWAYHDHHHHHFHNRPWVPFISLILSGVFATFPQFLNMANVSAGTNLVTSLTSYQATTPGNARAAPVSMPVIRACAIGLRTNATSTMPTMRRLPTYSPRPCMKRSSSLRASDARVNGFRSSLYSRASGHSRTAGSRPARAIAEKFLDLTEESGRLRLRILGR